MGDGALIMKHILGKKGAVIIAALLLMGICLMLLGGASGAKKESASSLEARIEALCEKVSGAQNIAVMVTTDSLGEVRGVAVVCRGGEDASVRLTLTDMLTALFGIPSSRVSIVGGG